MTLFLIILAVVLIGIAIYLFTKKKGTRLPQKISQGMPMFGNSKIDTTKFNKPSPEPQKEAPKPPERPLMPPPPPPAPPTPPPPTFPPAI